jgi:hypothetical protein
MLSYLLPDVHHHNLCCCGCSGDDKIILVDFTLLPIISRIAPQLPQLQAVVVLTDRYA